MSWEIRHPQQMGTARQDPVLCAVRVPCGWELRCMPSQGTLPPCPTAGIPEGRLLLLKPSSGVSFARTERALDIKNA